MHVFIELCVCLFSYVCLLSYLLVFIELCVCLLSYVRLLSSL